MAGAGVEPPCLVSTHGFAECLAQGWLMREDAKVVWAHENVTEECIKRGVRIEMSEDLEGNH